jgi:hypothetical protein
VCTSESFEKAIEMFREYCSLNLGEEYTKEKFKHVTCSVSPADGRLWYDGNLGVLLGYSDD